MSSRIVIPSLMVLALGLGGCAAGAAGGGGGGAAVAAAQIDTDNLPEWALAFPEGTPPRDNDQTNEAAVALFQASSTPDPARMATFFQDALAMAEAGIAADPGNPQSYFQAGEAHLGLGNLGEAGQAFDRAEELYPLYVLDTRFLREEAWIDAYNEGVAVVESDPAAAQPHFERAHAAYRGRPEAMFQLGQFYIEQARNSDAIEVYSQALEAIQSPVGREGIDPEPLAAWDAAVQPILFSLGQLYMSEQRYAEAIETYDEILESNPGDLTATSNLAGALVSEGETERANAVLNQLLSRTDLSSRQSFAVGPGPVRGRSVRAGGPRLRAGVRGHAGGSPDPVHARSVPLLQRPGGGGELARGDPGRRAAPDCGYAQQELHPLPIPGALEHPEHGESQRGRGALRRAPLRGDGPSACDRSGRSSRGRAGDEPHVGAGDVGDDSHHVL